MDMFGGMINLQNALDAAALRQKVISSNIANINTPGYQPKAVAFEEHLKKAMVEQAGGFDTASLGFTPEEEQLLKLGPGGVGNIKPTIHQSSGKMDISQEMVNLAKNQIYYDALTMRISGYLSSLKYVVENSGR